MPPPNQLSVGIVTTLTQNVVYATPQSVCHFTTSVALQGSMDGATGWAALVPPDLSGWISIPYVRCSTGNAVVIFKK